MKGDGAKELRREKVYIKTDLSTKELAEKYGISITTAGKIKKRGWFVKNYMQKHIILDRDNFNPKAAYNLAGRVFLDIHPYLYI